MIRLAINGFGRIGRTAFKVAFEKENIEIVAINDLTDAKTLAHLLKYDSNYGKYRDDIRAEEGALYVGGKRIRVIAKKEPADLPWKELKIDIVLECTGRFVETGLAEGHITAGAKRVIISAPSKGANPAPTYLLGVNADSYGQEHVINNASCTTNCIAPTIAVLSAKFGIVKAFMTTVHGYTADQNLQDGPHKDLRRARGAATNIVPTTTGATLATSEAIPELKGKFDGVALRVPVPVGSIADITAIVSKKTNVSEVNEAFREAARSSRYEGILTVTDEPLVSSDIVGTTYSAIVDLSLTQVLEGDFIKVFAWYDNEFAYSNRLVEQAILVGKSMGL